MVSDAVGGLSHQTLRIEKKKKKRKNLLDEKKIVQILDFQSENVNNLTKKSLLFSFNIKIINNLNKKFKKTLLGIKKNYWT